jgi:hypothetical protein
MITLMKIEVSPYSLLGKPEQGLNFFLKSKKEFPMDRRTRKNENTKGGM